MEKFLKAFCCIDIKNKFYTESDEDDIEANKNENSDINYKSNEIVSNNGIYENDKNEIDEIHNVVIIGNKRVKIEEDFINQV